MKKGIDRNTYSQSGIYSYSSKKVLNSIAFLYPKIHIYFIKKRYVELKSIGILPNKSLMNHISIINSLIIKVNSSF